MLRQEGGPPCQHTGGASIQLQADPFALGPVAAVLNRQTGALTEDQRLMIDTHPLAGVELLQAAGVDDEVWLEAVLQHHERLDGSGYPSGLEGDAISPGARMLAIVDIYSAMVRPRAYREAIHARHALRSLFSLAQQYRYSGCVRDDFAANNAAARAALEKFGDLPQDVLEGTRRSKFAPPIVRRGLQQRSDETAAALAADESATTEAPDANAGEDEQA